MQPSAETSSCVIGVWKHSTGVFIQSNFNAPQRGEEIVVAREPLGPWKTFDEEGTCLFSSLIYRPMLKKKKESIPCPFQEAARVWRSQTEEDFEEKV